MSLSCILLQLVALHGYVYGVLIEVHLVTLQKVKPYGLQKILTIYLKK